MDLYKKLKTNILFYYIIFSLFPQFATEKTSQKLECSVDMPTQSRLIFCVPQSEKSRSSILHTWTPVVFTRSVSFGPLPWCISLVDFPTFRH